MKSVKEIQQINQLTPLNYSRDEMNDLEKKAKNLIESLTGSFLKEAVEFVQEMELLLQEAALLGKSERTYLFKNRFFQLAHDLKGQGTTYGFELITLLAGHVCDEIRQKKYFSQKEIDLFAEDVSDMKKVLYQLPHETNVDLQKEILTRLERIKCPR